jgi:predicted enzyme related to lactoylglutathione lyase
MQVDLDQIDLVAADMEATVAFYRAVGVEIPEEAIWRTASGAHHVDLDMPGGLHLQFDSPALAREYDAGWSEPTGPGTRIVLNFRLASRPAVDALHDKLCALGHQSAQSPYDTFWGSRYAIIEDPDGNHIGLMSPSDPALRSAPPDI